MISIIEPLNDGKTNFAGKYSVKVTLLTNETYETTWSPEELKVEQFILAFRKTNGDLLADELANIIAEYGQYEYSEGYEEAEYHGKMNCN